MNICQMCTHNGQKNEDDDFTCNIKCDEYLEFAALPIYEAAPDMYEALKVVQDYLGAINLDENGIFKTVVNDALSKAEGGKHLPKLKGIALNSNKVFCRNCKYFYNKEPDSVRGNMWYNHFCRTNPAKVALSYTGDIELAEEKLYRFCRDCNPDCACRKFEPSTEGRSF